MADPVIHVMMMMIALILGDSGGVYRGGKVTPLTFARYRLNPLAAFTSGAYFLHNVRR